MGRFVETVAGERDASARLARLLDDWSVVGAALVDVDSGMALATHDGRAGGLDLELVGAAHADLVRGTFDTLAALHPSGPPTELVLSHGDGLHHLVRAVADPFGGRLALVVIVSGPQRTVTRMRRALRRIGADALVPRPASARPAHSATARPAGAGGPRGRSSARPVSAVPGLDRPASGGPVPPAGPAPARPVPPVGPAPVRPVGTGRPAPLPPTLPALVPVRAEEPHRPGAGAPPSTRPDLMPAGPAGDPIPAGGPGAAPPPVLPPPRRPTGSVPLPAGPPQIPAAAPSPPATSPFPAATPSPAAPPPAGRPGPDRAPAASGVRPLPRREPGGSTHPGIPHHPPSDGSAPGASWFTPATPHKPPRPPLPRPADDPPPAWAVAGGDRPPTNGPG